MKHLPQGDAQLLRFLLGDGMALGHPAQLGQGLFQAGIPAGGGGRAIGQEVDSPPESYDGWRINQRPPRVGDVGTIVEILQAPGLSDRYVVETSGPDGITVWLGDFQAEELAATAAEQAVAADTPAAGR